MSNKRENPIDWLIENLYRNNEPTLQDKVIIGSAKEKLEEMLCDLVEQLKDYTHQSKSILGHDEREPIEFVEIFLNKQEDENN